MWSLLTLFVSGSVAAKSAPRQNLAPTRSDRWGSWDSENMVDGHDPQSGEAGRPYANCPIIGLFMHWIRGKPPAASQWSAPAGDISTIVHRCRCRHTLYSVSCAIKQVVCHIVIGGSLDSARGCRAEARNFLTILFFCPCRQIFAQACEGASYFILQVRSSSTILTSSRMSHSRSSQ
jgi:hypothetical protein